MIDLLEGAKSNMLVLDIERFLHEGGAEGVKKWRGGSGFLG